MTSWKTPTAEQVSKAIALLGHAEQVRYFFDRLENPLWLVPLKGKGFFNEPPRPSSDEKGWIRYPMWPASRYLARVASRSPEPQIVMDVVLHIANTGTENVRVQEDLLDAAMVLPGELAARLLPRAITWLDRPRSLRHDKLGEFMGYLAVEGRAEEALTLARKLFEVLPASTAGGIRTGYLHKAASPRLDIPEYQSILRLTLKPLVDAVGLRILQLFCDLLDTAVRESLSGEDGEAAEDYSYIWRPAIEDDQKGSHGIRSVLVSAVRDAAERISANHPEQIRTLIHNLEGRVRKVFHRLALHLMRKFPDSIQDFIAARLTDPALFDDTHLHHEYAMLASEQFRRLDPDAQQAILGLIEAGPTDAEQRAVDWEERTVQRPTPEQLENYHKTWQLKRLTPIQHSLPEAWRERYQRLVSEFGEPEPPVSPHAIYVRGHRSPKSLDDLKQLSPTQLRGYLQTWQPPEDKLGMPPSPEGLGQEIGAMIAAMPEKYVPEAQVFEGLDPTYVRAFLQGVRDAAGTDKTFSWDPVLDLCQWVMDQPRTIDGRRVDRWSADPDWVWTRRTIVDLLKIGFKKEVAEIPYAFRARVWRLLACLAEDPDPDATEDSLRTCRTLKNA